MFFALHGNSKSIANITSDKMSQSAMKVEDQILLCKFNPNFLSPSEYFNFATSFAVDVFLLKERVQGFNEIGKGRVKTGFLDSKSLTNLKVFSFEKHKLPLCDILLQWWLK